jgi:hypothetical protein
MFQKNRADSIFYLETSLTIYQSARRHIQENLNLCVCVYVCMYVYVCIYIYIHICMPWIQTSDKMKIECGICDKHKIIQSMQSI